MESKSDIAAAKFLGGFNCAQSVVYSYHDDLQIDANAALKIACGFGAGMGRTQETCGAVAGGIIVIGAKYGRGELDDRSTTELTYAKTRELMERFFEKHGTCVCRNLLHGCDLTTAEGQKEFKENDYLHKVCAPCVQSVVEILDGIIDSTNGGMNE
jgi:C_GCAxxG_C_C family probable redox protein